MEVTLNKETDLYELEEHISVYFHTKISPEEENYVIVEAKVLESDHEDVIHNQTSIGFAMFGSKQNEDPIEKSFYKGSPIILLQKELG